MVNMNIREITTLDIPSPCPPVGSNCDFGLLDETNWQAAVWASPGGGGLFRCYAQQLTTTRVPITAASIVLSRSKDISEFTDPLIFGFVKESVLNSTNFYDTQYWEGAWGVTADLLPEKNVEYWLTASTDLTFDYTENIYFVAVSMQDGGWYIHGVQDNPLPSHQLLYLNVGIPMPNPDGLWEAINEDMSCLMYTAGGMPPNQGLAHYENPNFPATAELGVAWYFSFDLYNMNTYYCGSPETMTFDIIDRVHDPNGNNPLIYGYGELPCGYYFGINNDDDPIGWTEPGTLYLRLRVGHVEGANNIIDETYDFDVEVTGCAGLNEEDCKNLPGSCYWYNGECHGTLTCSIINNQTDCIYNNCYWWDGSCHSTQEPQCDQLDETECKETAGCFWYNNACHSSLDCEIVNNETDCIYNDCYWWGGACHSTPSTCSPDGITECFGDDMYICQEGQWVLQQENHPDCIGQIPCSQYQNKTDCELAGCFWYKKYFWETEKCHSERYDWFQAYMPLMIAGGVGVAALVAVSLLRRPAQIAAPPPTPYYRPPYPAHYPPPHEKPPKYPYYLPPPSGGR